MDKLKIALYTQSFPPKGGGVSTTHYNIYNLLKDSYNIKVFVFNENENLTSKNLVKRKTIKWLNTIVLRLIKIKYKSNSKKSELFNVKSIIGSFIPIMRLNAPLKKFNPDIIIVPDYNIPNYLIKKPKNAKLVLVAHHNYYRFRNNILLENFDFLDTDIASSMERNAIKKVDAVISPSQFMISSYKESLYAGKPVFCIHNFIEQKVFNLLKNRSKVHTVFPKNKKIIYIPSAGSIIKGKRYVFEIIRRLVNYDNDAYFYLSGGIPGDLKLELTPFKDKIYAPGHIKWEDNFVNVMQCHIGITPNLEENFSNAILEAQISGVPFVVFDTGGNKEIIINDSTGFIVPYLDIESLISRSCSLLNDANRHKKFKKNAIHMCNERFNSDLIRNQYSTVLNKIQQI